MASQNLTKTRIKPATSALLTLEVLRSVQLSPHFIRVTVGGGDIERFTPMGFDQWFRLAIPVSGTSLSRVPNKLTMVAYLRFLTVAKAERAILRSFTVRAFRPDGPQGPELDIDFVVHGSAGAGTGGAAANWAAAARPGDPLGIIDEGLGFNPPSGLEQVFLVAEESGVPAAAGILASLSPTTRGRALLEVPAVADIQQIDHPEGVDVRWLVRDTQGTPNDLPGRLALVETTRAALPTGPFYGWVVGETSLATGVRRHWVASGVPKSSIMFCGYWKPGRAH